jgi:hypothetical protein
MAINFFGTANGRPLFIDFDEYTDGDAEFKKELVVSMVSNLQELQQVLPEALQNNDVALFNKLCHKIKVTLEMLKDEELLETIEQLKTNIKDSLKVRALDRICADIIKSLNR